MIRFASACQTVSAFSVSALSVAIFSAAALFSGAAQAANPVAPKKADLVKGSAIAQAVCASCHAADGNGVGNANPKLAGQHADYLYKQLVNFKVQPNAKGPARVSPIMNGFAAALSEEDMRNVAGFYASQALKPSTAKNKDLVELGQRIFRGGIAAKNVPACASCHSPNGAGMPAQYPRLSGQWAEYAEAQLIAFRSGARANNPAMTAIASRLSDKEIKAVADYSAGLR